MADARAESILAALKSLLSGLSTTGTNVQRGQLYAHQAANLPALALFMGDDVLEAENLTGYDDWLLTILIQSTVAIDETYDNYEPLVDQQLNQIRKEVHAALMADRSLGLSYVIDTRPISASQPGLSNEGAAPHGSQVLEFQVMYRASRADISA